MSKEPTTDELIEIIEWTMDGMGECVFENGKYPNSSLSAHIKHLDKVKDRLTQLQAEKKNRCDHCGANLNLSGCSTCGAPVCCPQCCLINTLQAENKALEDRCDGLSVEDYIDTSKDAVNDLLGRLESLIETNQTLTNENAALKKKIENVTKIANEPCDEGFELCFVPNGILKELEK